MAGQRGRLIFPSLAELYQLDTVATAAPVGGFSSGYDDDFREPVKVPPSPAAGPGTTRRVEKAPIRVRCQVETGRFDQLSPLAAGNAPQTQLVLVFHFRDLEKAGLLDATTNAAALRIGDRLHAIYTVRGVLEQVMVPPVYLTEIRPSSFGLTGQRRNLLVTVFDVRDAGQP